MKMCDKHFQDILAKVAACGLDGNDRPEDTAPSDVFQVSAAVTALYDEHGDGVSMPFHPTLMMQSAIYAGGIERYGQGITGVNPKTMQLFCPLCCDRETFDLHVAGKCPDPANCEVGEVKATDQPWDVESIELTGNSMYEWAKEQGVLGPVQ